MALAIIANILGGLVAVGLIHVIVRLDEFVGEKWIAKTYPQLRHLGYRFFIAGLVTILWAALIDMVAPGDIGPDLDFATWTLGVTIGTLAIIIRLMAVRKGTAATGDNFDET